MCRAANPDGPARYRDGSPSIECGDNPEPQSDGMGEPDLLRPSWPNSMVVVAAAVEAPACEAGRSRCESGRSPQCRYRSVVGQPFCTRPTVVRFRLTGT